jgi:hypothetical protein
MASNSHTGSPFARKVIGGQVRCCGYPPRCPPGQSRQVHRSEANDRCPMPRNSHLRRRAGAFSSISSRPKSLFWFCTVLCNGGRDGVIVVRPKKHAHRRRLVRLVDAIHREERQQRPRRPKAHGFGRLVDGRARLPTIRCQIPCCPAKRASHQRSARWAIQKRLLLEGKCKTSVATRQSYPSR